MHSMRKSISRRRLRKKQEDGDLKHESSSTSTKPKSSVDTFVINRRTRYPSSKDTEPNPSDLDIAQRLLSYESNTNSKSFENAAPSAKRDTRQASATTTGTSSVYSTVQSAISSTAFEVRDTQHFQDRFNALARVYGLRLLGPILDVDPLLEDKATENRLSLAKILWRRILRKQPSKYLPRQSSQSLLRKASMSSLFGSKSLLDIQYSSLEEAFRACGASIVYISHPYSCRAFTLIAPTCIAATANHLVLHGRAVEVLLREHGLDANEYLGPSAHGIFRIPGKPSIVNSLYQHYLIRLRHDEPTMANVQSNIGCSRLPPDLRYSTHDVASAFIKFIRTVPGGILGSRDLYDALNDISKCSKINNSVHAEKRNLVSRLVALVLGCIKSTRRLSLICVVFGLLAGIVQDSSISFPTSPLEEASSIRQPETDRGESCESTALEDVVLAFSPLLVHSLAVDTTNSSTRQQHARSVSDTSARRSRIKHGGNEVSLNPVDENQDSARLIRMLVIHWVEVMSHLQNLEQQRHLGAIPRRRSNLTQRNLRAISSNLNSSTDKNSGGPIVTVCNRWLDGTQASEASTGHPCWSKVSGAREDAIDQTEDCISSDHQTTHEELNSDNSTFQLPKTELCCPQSGIMDESRTVGSEENRNPGNHRSDKDEMGVEVSNPIVGATEGPVPPDNRGHRMSSTGTTLFHDRDIKIPSSQLSNGDDVVTTEENSDNEGRESLHKLLEAFGEELASSEGGELTTTKPDRVAVEVEATNENVATHSAAEYGGQQQPDDSPEVADDTGEEPPQGERQTECGSSPEKPLVGIPTAAEYPSTPVSSTKKKRCLLPRPTSSLRMEASLSSMERGARSNDSPKKEQETPASAKQPVKSTPNEAKYSLHPFKDSRLAALQTPVKSRQRKKDISLLLSKSTGDIRGPTQAAEQTPTTPMSRGSQIRKSSPMCKEDDKSNSFTYRRKNAAGSVATSQASRPKVGTLYQEIRTVSEQLREKEKEYRFWKERAERAENALIGQEAKRKASQGSSSSNAANGERSTPIAEA